MACSPQTYPTTNVFLLPSSLSLLPLHHKVHPRGVLPFRSAHLVHGPCIRGSACVARFGFDPGFLPDSDKLEEIKGLLERAESMIYTVADAAVSSSDTVTSATSTSTQQNGDWLSGITNVLETVLKVMKDGLSSVHVPYAYGFAIILLTILVKAATFPLTKKQVESTMAMRSLQPQIKAIQERYAGNQEKIQLETARVYKLAGINPFAGCLPTLATIPVWIGLYRALSNVANEGLLTEGFFWIPSLAGPTTIADRQNGTGISWLFPFIDGHPPLGWSATLAYLVLPLLLVISQYISVQIMQASQSNDPNTQNAQAVTKLLPLMIGYFALSVPSGLSLYWFTNNILSTAQQVWLQKLGGAKIPSKQLKNDVLKEEIAQISKPTSTNNFNSRADNAQVQESASSKPRPGERFKQIKEEEARRRRLKEATSLSEIAQLDDTIGNGHGEKSNSINGVNRPLTHENVVASEAATPNIDKDDTTSHTEASRDETTESSIERQQGVVEVNGSVSREGSETSEDKIEATKE